MRTETVVDFQACGPLVQAVGVPDIDGLTVTPLRRIPDERGAVLPMLRDDSPVFEHFGEIYFSMIYPGVIKGWHLHREMTLNYAVPIGMIKLVCFDDRAGSPTMGNLVELHIGELNYALVTIPPNVWNGFKGEGPGQAMVANCSTVHHRDDEISRLDPFSDRIPYDWSLRHG
jgi:dTDP-4-dehydrorhamnose 3,5-epimerase